MTDFLVKNGIAVKVAEKLLEGDCTFDEIKEEIEASAWSLVGEPSDDIDTHIRQEDEVNQLEGELTYLMFQELKNRYSSYWDK